MASSKYSKTSIIGILLLIPYAAYADWIFTQLSTQNLAKVRYFSGVLGFQDYQLNECKFFGFDTTTGKPTYQATINPTISRCRDFDFFVDPDTGSQYIYTLENAQLRVRKRSLTSLLAYDEITNFAPVNVTGSIDTMLCFSIDFYHKIIYIIGLSNFIRVDISNLEKPTVTGSMPYPGAGDYPYNAAVVGNVLHIASLTEVNMYNIAGNTISQLGKVRSSLIIRLRSVLRYKDYAIYTSEQNSGTLLFMASSNGTLLGTLDLNTNSITGGVIGVRSLNDLMVLASRSTTNRLVYLSTQMDQTLRIQGYSQEVRSNLPVRDDVQDLAWIGDYIILSAGNKIAFDLVVNQIPQSDFVQKYSGGSIPEYPYFHNPLRIAFPKNPVVLKPSSNVQFNLNVWDDFTNYTFIPITVRVTPTTSPDIILSFIRVNGQKEIITFEVTYSITDIRSGMFQLERQGEASSTLGSYVDFIASDGRSGYIKQRLLINYEVDPSRGDSSSSQKILVSTVTGAAIGAFISCYILTLIVTLLIKRFMNKKAVKQLKNQTAQSNATTLSGHNTPFPYQTNGTSLDSVVKSPSSMNLTTRSDSPNATRVGRVDNGTKPSVDYQMHRSGSIAYSTMNRPTGSGTGQLSNNQTMNRSRNESMNQIK